MRKYPFILFTFLLMHGLLHAQVSGIVKWIQGTDFSIQTSGEYTEILSESRCYTEEVGNPKMPVCVKSFYVPNTADISSVRVTAVNKRLIDKDILVYPAQYPVPVRSGDHPAWVKPNQVVYNSSTPFPGKYAEIISNREDFGHQIVTVMFYPIEYIPQKKELYLYDLSFSLEYSSNRSALGIFEPEMQSPRLKKMDIEYVKSIVDNPELVESSVSTVSRSVSPLSMDVPEYLIITNEDLKSTFQILADWKTKKGVPTIIETVENIVNAYKGSDNQEKIRNYLAKMRTKYGSLFVLLGGDTNIIPARMKNTRESEKINLAAIDYYYACAGQGTWVIDGSRMIVTNLSGNDFGLSFKLGRAPVENQTEAETFVKKVIKYEKCIGIEDTRYYNNTLVADAFIGHGKCNTYLLYDEGKTALINNYNDYNNYVNGDSRSWFMYDDYLAVDTFRCKYNWSTIICDTLKKLRDPVSRNGFCLPGSEELTNSSFLSALNNGGNSNYGPFHIVYHMDHSSPTGMGTSSLMKNQSITKTDADQLSNGNYSQIVMSGGCTPAEITKDCIAEHLLNNPNGGAVAFIGNTDIGWSIEYSQFQKFCQELYKISSYASNRYDLSTMQIKANGYLNSANCSLHLFGDPEMQVWTGIPQDLDVIITPASVQSGLDEVEINIYNLSPGQTATVCFQKANEVYSVHEMQNGSQTFAVSPKSGGNLEITITAHNFKPFEMSIPVVGSWPIFCIDELSYYDDGSSESIGDGDGKLDAGETVGLAVALKNTGNLALNNVDAILTCSSDKIQIKKGYIFFGNIPANTTKTVSSRFKFKIDSAMEEHSMNEQNPIEFSLKLSSNNITLTETFNIDVFAPDIKIGNQKVTWTSNGNMTIEAGETVKMDIDLMNVGRAEATGLKAVLMSNNSQANCLSTEVIYPDISFAMTQKNTGSFQFQTSTNYSGALSFTLQISNEYGKTWSFPINPLSRPTKIDMRDINFHPFSSSINIYWNSKSGVAGYNIYRSDNGENGVYRKLNTFPLTATFYLDEHLSECTVYHYKVTAIFTNGNEGELSTGNRMWTSYPTVSPFPQRITTADGYQSETCPNIGDVDNDGKQEIFWVNEYPTDRISYLMGFRPNGEELYNIDNNVTTVSGFDKTTVMLKNQVAFGDLSATGEQNIVVSSWEDNSNLQDRNKVLCYSAFDKNGDGRPDLVWEKSIPHSMFQSPVIANLDGSSDGTQEVVIKSHFTSDIFILDHKGNELRRLNPNALDNNSNYSALTVADLDGDGKMEIIASYNVLGIYIWRYDGTPFTENPFWGAGNPKLSSAPVVCDLNEDGKKEIIFSQNNIATSRVYAISLDGNKTVAGWNDSQTIPYTSNGYSLDHTLSVGDIDNDGHLEVVILGKGVVKAWRHNGSLLFSKNISDLFPEVDWAGNINTPILADVDGDAVPDVVFCAGRNIYALDNKGNEILGFPIIGDADFPDTPCVGDIDNDGKNELIAGDDESNLYVWKTDGVPSAIEWGVKRGNPQNTGEYFANVCKPMLITTDTFWNGEQPCGNVVVQSGRLVISAGQTISLNGTSTIIVRAGGVLEVDAGKLLNARVKVLNGGKVIIKNGGYIRLRNGSDFEMEKGGLLDCRYGMIDKAN